MLAKSIQMDRSEAWPGASAWQATVSQIGILRPEERIFH